MDRSIEEIEKAKEELENAINNSSNSEDIFNKSKQIDELISEFYNKQLGGENPNAKNSI